MSSLRLKPPRLSDEGGKHLEGKPKEEACFLSHTEEADFELHTPSSLSRSHLVVCFFFLTCPVICVDLVSPNRKEPLMVVTTIYISLLRLRAPSQFVISCYLLGINRYSVVFAFAWNVLFLTLCCWLMSTTPSTLNSEVTVMGSPP